MRRRRYVGVRETGDYRRIELKGDTSWRETGAG